MYDFQYCNCCTVVTCPINLRRLLSARCNTGIISGISITPFCWSSSCSPAALAEANNDATETSVQGRSGHHASHGEACPAAVESAPSGADTQGARPEALTVNMRRPDHAFGIYQRSERGGNDGSKDIDGNGSSSSSASSAKKRRRKRARRARAAQRKNQACADAATYDTQQTLAREDGRKMRAPHIENSTPSTSREFGTDVTNRGEVGPTTGCGTGDVSEGAPTSPKEKLERRDSMTSEPTGRKSGRKPACGRDVCGVVVNAEGDQCTNGEDKRVCFACHRPSKKWRHFSQSYLSRVTECLDDAKKHGVPLPHLVLEGYRSSTDCLCVEKGCIWNFVMNSQYTHKRKRELCAVCKADRTRNMRHVSACQVDEAVRFFTSGKGKNRRDRSVDCTGTWLTEKSLLCGTCRLSLPKGENRSANTPTSEVQRMEHDGHSASRAKARAKVEIHNRLDRGRVVIMDETLHILVEERRKLECEGQDTYERRIAREVLQEVADKAGISSAPRDMKPHDTCSTLCTTCPLFI